MDKADADADAKVTWQKIKDKIEDTYDVIVFILYAIGYILWGCLHLTILLFQLLLLSIIVLLFVGAVVMLAIEILFE